MGLKILILLVFALILLIMWRAWLRRVRLHFLSEHPLPATLRARLRAKTPGRSDAQHEAVERGLRQFFRICAQARGRFVAMPSKAVDAAWHEFLLDTRSYQRYCQQGFGRLLHHVPADAGISTRAADRGSQTANEKANQAAHVRMHEGLRRCWDAACKDEGLNPLHSARLPLLFALDVELGLAGEGLGAANWQRLGEVGGSAACGGFQMKFTGGSTAGSDGADTGGADGGDGDGGGCGGD